MDENNLYKIKYEKLKKRVTVLLGIILFIYLYNTLK